MPDQPGYAATQQRVIHAFVSFTFRDMKEERDWLVKVVFPELRERLEKHRIHLVDIDLRWGVTEEQANNDEVLTQAGLEIYCLPAKEPSGVLPGQKA